MKNKLAISILIIILALALTSCSSNGSKSEQSAIKELEITNSKVEKGTKDYLQIGFDLMKSEKLGNISLGMKLNQVTAVLGEPDVKAETELWEADGEYHQAITYNTKGIELDFTGEEDANKILYSIIAANSCSFKTLRGITIGSTISDVEQKYKDEIDPEFSDAEAIVAGSVYGGIIFTLDNDTVKSIFIGANAE